MSNKRKAPQRISPCKFYEFSGILKNEACPHGKYCWFVHPEDDEWDACIPTRFRRRPASAASTAVAAAATASSSSRRRSPSPPPLRPRSPWRRRDVSPTRDRHRSPSPHRRRSSSSHRERDYRSRERDRDRSRSRERDRDRDRGRSRDGGRDRDRERDKYRERDRNRERDRERDKDRDYDRDRERDRERTFDITSSPISTHSHAPSPTSHRNRDRTFSTSSTAAPPFASPSLPPPRTPIFPRMPILPPPQSPGFLPPQSPGFPPPQSPVFSVRTPTVPPRTPNIPPRTPTIPPQTPTIPPPQTSILPQPPTPSMTSPPPMGPPTLPATALSLIRAPSPSPSAPASSSSSNNKPRTSSRDKRHWEKRTSILAQIAEKRTALDQIRTTLASHTRLLSATRPSAAELPSTLPTASATLPTSSAAAASTTAAAAAATATLPATLTPTRRHAIWAHISRLAADETRLAAELVALEKHVSGEGVLARLTYGTVASGGSAGVSGNDNAGGSGGSSSANNSSGGIVPPSEAAIEALAARWDAFRERARELAEKVDACAARLREAVPSAKALGKRPAAVAGAGANTTATGDSMDVDGGEEGEIDGGGVAVDRPTLDDFYAQMQDWVGRLEADVDELRNAQQQMLDDALLEVRAAIDDHVERVVEEYDGAEISGIEAGGEEGEGGIGGGGEGEGEVSRRKIPLPDDLRHALKRLRAGYVHLREEMQQLREEDEIAGRAKDEEIQRLKEDNAALRAFVDEMKAGYNAQRAEFDQVRAALATQAEALVLYTSSAAPSAFASAPSSSATPAALLPSTDVLLHHLGPAIDDAVRTNLAPRIEEYRRAIGAKLDAQADYVERTVLHRVSVSARLARVVFDALMRSDPAGMQAAIDRMEKLSLNGQGIGADMRAAMDGASGVDGVDGMDVDAVQEASMPSPPRYFDLAGNSAAAVFRESKPSLPAATSAATAPVTATPATATPVTVTATTTPALRLPTTAEAPSPTIPPMQGPIISAPSPPWKQKP